jgi:subtilisin family serine protease
MSMNMGNVVYWHKNQVIIRLEPQLPPTQTILTGIQNSLNTTLNNLNLQLQIFDAISLSSPPASADSKGSANTLLFCHIIPAMPDDEGAVSMGNDDNTLAVIKHFSMNNNKILQTALQEQKLSTDHKPIPHWLWSGTDDTIHGCPVSPPIPVEDSKEPGQWKITLPQLADSSLQQKTGEGVTVFVLDTLPAMEQIERAAKNAHNNLLLQKMVSRNTNSPQQGTTSPAIKYNYSIDVPEPAESAMTGKDIYGRLVGFPMADHGLAISGIIRDMAPAANIECVRVLNDYGVGNLLALLKALTSIQQWMDNHKNSPVVINMSLVVLPPENGIPDGVTDDILQSSREVLYNHMQKLADSGAVFVATAGNDSDPRDFMMNRSEIRFGPRYPAALAYDTPPVTALIPVGAVNRNGKPAMYSNHPGHLGIATYGGELPKPDPWLPSAMYHGTTRVDTSEPIDALRCLHTASVYPALSANDHHAILPSSSSAYPMYEASNTWAYWSGTSFASPIISALAALLLQGQDPQSFDVRQAIIDAATEMMWTRIGDDKEDIGGHMIMAVQEWQPEDTSSL